MVTTVKEVRTLMDMYPLLNVLGYGRLHNYDTDAARAELLTPGFIREVNACRAWLQGVTKTQQVNPRAGNSYGFKHVVEHAVGQYVRNGAFIVAALLEGFKMSGDFNPHFNIAKPRRSKVTTSTSTRLTGRRRGSW